jgi:phage terminase small subunit
MPKTKKSLKRDKFVREYLANGGHGSNAAIAAGYSKTEAATRACTLLKRQDVQEALAEAQAEYLRRTDVSAERVFRELAKIAFLNPKRVLGVGGPKSGSGARIGAGTWMIRKLQDIADEDTCAIASVKHFNEGKGKTRDEVKFHDKLRALDILSKCLGMQTQKLEHSGPDGQPFPVRVYIPDNTRGVSGEAKEVKE